MVDAEIFLPSCSKTNRGFTLIELLVVIAIVGIVTAAIVTFSARSFRESQLRDGAAQLVADLNRARSQSQRTSSDSLVRLSGTFGNPNQNYTTQWAGATAQSSKALPNPIRVAPQAVGLPNVIKYAAPYGEITNATAAETGAGNVGTGAISGAILEISSLSTTSRLYVKVVGVTGKVILSATP
jgi:prepilin-type N-terminal cleavage/methylation domain-containing protein